MAPLLAVTQVLGTPEALAFLGGRLLPDLGATVTPGASGPDGAVRGTPGMKGPQGKRGACLSFECDKSGDGRVVYSPSFHSLLFLRTSATVNYRCWDTATGAEGEPK